MQLVETLVVYKKVDDQFIKIVLSRRKKRIMSLCNDDLIHNIVKFKCSEKGMALF